ncbi:restriction endonuclease subunit S [Paenibacillus sp. MABNR03]|uniref:restriction endonuclease subunit S n=1 Tax=Paenibacillus sp. MABNR03 TaxID=3142626 RepID=UPI003D2816E8
MKLGDVIEIEKNNLIQIEDKGSYVIAGVQSYGQGIVNRKNVTGTELTMKQYQVIKPNQLMWCKVDTKNGAFGVTKKDHQDSLASTNMALANILLDKANPEFIQLLFQMPFFYNYINGLSTGTTNRKYLKIGEVFSKIEIPDLSLEQQDKFVKWYNKFKQQFDKLLCEDNKQVELIQTLRQSILQEAVQGKLVPQDPDDEPASVLLEKIKAEKEKLIKEKKIKKEKLLPAITDDEISYQLPQGWEWVRLGEVMECIGGSQPPKNLFIYEPREGYTRLVQIRDFKSNEYATFIPNEYANRPFTEDDVMIGRYGPPIFQILKGLKGTYNVALMKASPNETVLSKDFVYYLLQETEIQNKVIKESDRTAGQSGVRRELIDSFVVGIPPQNEQKRIVGKINQLMALCDDLEKSIEQSKQDNEKFKQAVLQEAFSAIERGDNVVEFPSANPIHIKDWDIAARSDGEIIADTKAKIKNRVTELLGK